MMFVSHARHGVIAKDFDDETDHSRAWRAAAGGRRQRLLLLGLVLQPLPAMVQPVRCARRCPVRRAHRRSGNALLRAGALLRASRARPNRCRIWAGIVADVLTSSALI
jgi:hypothetical protein